ncbi:aryl-alcohol dehydrogenase-like predicted oxidoreductase [Lachnospiraceae bacterium PM6-15]|uniref:hypothetical protein n=1 Tax=Ohessyouella blattaphilus TaxID=2949333 RepID=UPI003E1F8AC7
MKKEPFGTTKLQLSNICYGTGNFGEKLTKEQALLTLVNSTLASGLKAETPMTK